MIFLKKINLSKISEDGYFIYTLLNLQSRIIDLGTYGKKYFGPSLPLVTRIFVAFQKVRVVDLNFRFKKCTVVNLKNIFLKMVTIYNGRVHYVSGQEIWMSDGDALLRSDDGGRTWIIRAKLPKAIGLERLVAYRLGRRLGRVGFHHFLKTDADAGLAIAHKNVFQLIPGNPELKRVAVLNGSRPLVFCLHDNAVYYGEYCSNPHRTQVHIWMSGINGNDWHPVWSFSGIRHVHGVFFDPYIPAIWVTTGDKNNESAIWMTQDSFQTLEQVAGGSQQHRAVQLLFTDKYVYFGSDSPLEQNHIYRINRTDLKIERLVEVNSSVFYGCKVGQSLFFSTAIEPSSVNHCRHAEVWGTPDGENWRLVERFRKDFWPIKYFQYGQVLFPAGPGDGEHLWCTPISTVNDQNSIKIKLDWAPLNKI